jgi:hypothetical protein
MPGVASMNEDDMAQAPLTENPGSDSGDSSQKDARKAFFYESQVEAVKSLLEAVTPKEKRYRLKDALLSIRMSVVALREEKNFNTEEIADLLSEQFGIQISPQTISRLLLGTYGSGPKRSKKPENSAAPMLTSAADSGQTIYKRPAKVVEIGPKPEKNSPRRASESPFRNSRSYKFPDVSFSNHRD